MGTYLCRLLRFLSSLAHTAAVPPVQSLLYTFQNPMFFHLCARRFGTYLRTYLDRFVKFDSRFDRIKIRVVRRYDSTLLSSVQIPKSIVTLSSIQSSVGTYVFIKILYNLGTDYVRTYILFGFINSIVFLYGSYVPMYLNKSLFQNFI